MGRVQMMIISTTVGALSMLMMVVGIVVLVEALFMMLNFKIILLLLKMGTVQDILVKAKNLPSDYEKSSYHGSSASESYAEPTI